ncbi:MAG: hypothetical protein GY699_09815 [Desulfobacteraceae bacterium]|nr:hypothetical protein [Desulfobacteraceae bacterium]
MLSHSLSTMNQRQVQTTTIVDSLDGISQLTIGILSLTFEYHDINHYVPVSCKSC